MKSLQIRIPDSIHEKIKSLAKDEGISMNTFIVSSVSNEVVRQETRDFFKKAASDFDPGSFADALASVPDAPVEETDTL